MKSIKMIRDKICSGTPVRAGELVEVEPRDASFLVAIGAAEYAEKPKRRKTRALKSDDLVSR